METALQPYFRRRYLLTKAERLFYKTLRRVVQQHVVLAKVRLADLIDANEQHHLWQANFNRIKSKHIDFVVCDAALAPIIAVELDDSSHERADRRARDRDVDQIFRFASLPILRVPVRQSYDESEIETQLLAKIRER